MARAMHDLRSSIHEAIECIPNGLLILSWWYHRCMTAATALANPKLAFTNYSHWIYYCANGKGRFGGKLSLLIHFFLGYPCKASASSSRKCEG
jgi:hypothetical protein